jgi:hypothetical protein
MDVTIDRLVKRAPGIAALTFGIALVAAWFSAPDWLCNGIALIVGGLALLVLIARGRRNEFRHAEAIESTRAGDWLNYELAGKGSPEGFYPLVAFGVITAVLTGFEAPYDKLAYAGLALAIAWGFVSARYPANEVVDEDL